jgi:hypothetical protein
MTDIPGTAQEVIRIALAEGWKLEEARIADTGSCYVELSRKRKEWVIIRIADHPVAYESWLKTHSISPTELKVEEVRSILRRPLGEVGDMLG